MSVESVMHLVPQICEKIVPYDRSMKLSTQLEDVFEKIFGYRGIANSSCGVCGMYFQLIANE